MPDPSSFSLPPEWVEAIERVLGLNGINASPADDAAAVERALAPLLAKRDAEVARQALTGYALPDDLVLERDLAVAEARGLREAADRALTNIRDGAPGIAASILSAALSASPDTEKRCENCRGSGYWQREGGGQDVTRACPVCHGAASSSSSEEGERAERDRTYWNEAAIEAARADALRALRERLTSDPIVEAVWKSQFGFGLTDEEGEPVSVPMPFVRHLLTGAADHLDNRTEGR